MNNQQSTKTMNTNFRAVFITTICCSIFWIATGIVFYRYTVNERTTPNDSEDQMMSGFYRRDVKIKMDSISNALIIQTLRNQLVERQIKIDSLEEAFMMERSNRQKRNYESEELMMYMNLMENLHKERGEIYSSIQVLNSNVYYNQYKTAWHWPKV
jgi:hypothetical protein